MNRIKILIDRNALKKYLAIQYIAYLSIQYITHFTIQYITHFTIQYITHLTIQYIFCTPDSTIFGTLWHNLIPKCVEIKIMPKMKLHFDRIIFIQLITHADNSLLRAAIKMKLYLFNNL